MKSLFDNLVVDVIAFALMIGMVATGYILEFSLPPGSNKLLSLWGLTRHEWGSVHFWIGLGLVAVILLHLVLHWEWIVITLKRRFWGASASGDNPLVSGVATLSVLVATLALFGWVADCNVTTISEPHEGICPPVETGSQPERPETANSKLSVIQTQVDFKTSIFPILEHSCISCHGPKKQISGVRLDRREDLLGVNATPPLVVPGKSSESPLIGVVSGQRKDIARPDAHRLTDGQVLIIRDWIDAGAR
jgi:hypothetical protein